MDLSVKTFQQYSRLDSLSYFELCFLIFVVTRGKVFHPWAMEVMGEERSTAAGEDFSDLQLRTLKG